MMIYIMKSLKLLWSNDIVISVVYKVTNVNIITSP